MINSIEGEITSQTEEGEQWEYDTTITEKNVTGWLRDKVRERVGKPEGVVTSWEETSSYGTCDICGSYSETIGIYVDGVEVYSGNESAGFEEGYPNPFIALTNWLNEKKENNNG